MILTTTSSIEGREIQQLAEILDHGNTVFFGGAEELLPWNI
ncbi:hypothetical protein FACS18949_18370 [Clostridia bacterium]|nr:hypothetical protein FACS18949_18370 [Clostridia bacterium]